jgi:hypothetical protein
MGFKLCCKNCGRDRLMQLEEMDKKDFKKLVEKFKRENKNIDLE